MEEHESVCCRKYVLAAADRLAPFISTASWERICLRRSFSQRTRYWLGPSPCWNGYGTSQSAAPAGTVLSLRRFGAVLRSLFDRELEGRGEGDCIAVGEALETPAPVPESSRTKDSRTGNIFFCFIRDETTSWLDGEGSDEESRE
jgi:hypothetical protein